jgi:hypothetical protein
MSWNELLLSMQQSNLAGLVGSKKAQNFVNTKSTKIPSGVSYNGDVPCIITDDIILSSLNTKLDIVNPQLHITMEELKIACQEKYPYKFI